MKNQLLFLVIFLQMSLSAVGQADKQWIIYNSTGKDGVTATGDNNYSESNLIENRFYLMGVEHPDLTVSGRNDILIIYKDGSHYNSRYVSPGEPGIFYNSADAAAGVENHIFSSTHSSAIAYSYLTNIYEEDDYPPAVRALGSSTLAIPTTYTIGTTTSPLLSANHNVAFTKDITVIVNLDSDSIGGATEVALRYDGVALHPSGPVIINNEILTLQPAFQSGGGDVADFPAGSVVPASPGILTINTAGDDNLRYANFRPTDEILQYIPRESGVSYDAVFSLMRGSTKIAELREQILHSHDPNLLRVDSICKRDDGIFIIFYHLEFENTGDVAATEYFAELDFPEFVDLSCIEVLDWYGGGSSCPGNLDIAGQHGKFNFNCANQLAPKASVGDLESKAYVNFRAKIIPGYDVADINKSIRLTNVMVTFDGVDFPLYEFYDLIKDQSRPIGPICTYCTTFIGGIDPGILWAAIIAMGGIGVLYTFRRRIWRS